MTDWQQQGLHRIEVDRDIDRQVTAVRFVCDGTPDAACHVFPDCVCEVWDDATHGENAAAGHEDVVHEKDCWVEPWFSEFTPFDWGGAYAGPAELKGDQLRSGQIEATYQGDYMTWEYATSGGRP